MGNIESIPAKRWVRIIPPAILVYIFGFMDRTNIGFANLLLCQFWHGVQ